MSDRIDTSPKALQDLADKLSGRAAGWLNDRDALLGLNAADVIRHIAAEKEAAAKQEPVGTLTVRRYRGHLENTDFDYSGALPDGSYPLYLALQPAPLPTDDPGTYYVSGPYHDGSMAVCRLDTGLVVHKFRLDGVAQPAPRPTAAEVPLQAAPSCPASSDDASAKQLRSVVRGWHERSVRLGADGVEDIIHAAEVAYKRGELRCVDGFVQNWFPLTLKTAKQTVPAEVPLPEPAGQIAEHGLNRTKSGQVITAVHDAYTADQLRTYAQDYADAVVAGMKAESCARIELVTALHCLASHFENSLYAFGGDVEGERKATGDIAHARGVAAKHNYNGPGCRGIETSVLKANGLVP